MMENIRAQRKAIPQAQTPNLPIQLESSPPNLLLNQSQPVLSPLIRRTRVTIKMTAQVLPNQTPRRAAHHLQRKTQPRRWFRLNLPQATMVLNLLRAMVVALRVVLIKQVAPKIQPAGELSCLCSALARSNSSGALFWPFKSAPFFNLFLSNSPNSKWNRESPWSPSNLYANVCCSQFDQHAHFNLSRLFISRRWALRWTPSSIPYPVFSGIGCWRSHHGCWRSCYFSCRRCYICWRRSLGSRLSSSSTNSNF